MEKANLILTRFVPLGQRFYPSESAFPLRSCKFFILSCCVWPGDLGFIASILVHFRLRYKQVLPTGWASRILIQCGVRYAEIWDILHEMYESQVKNFLILNAPQILNVMQVSPFNDQGNVQVLNSEIAILITDWLAEATRPQANILRAEFPVSRMDAAIDQYLSELAPTNTETRTLYENAKRQLRRYWWGFEKLFCTWYMPTICKWYTILCYFLFFDN